MSDPQKTKALASVLQEYLMYDAFKFFSNMKRLDQIVSVIEQHVAKDSQILDLACGPMVLAFQLDLDGYRSILCVDRKTDYKKLHSTLKNRGLMSNVTFEIGDLNNLAFLAQRRFDAIIIHDALYENLDLNTLFHFLPEILNEKGTLFFDIWSKEFQDKVGRFSSKASTKYASYKRYTTKDITEILKHNKLDVIEIKPVFGTSLMQRVSRRILFTVFRVSNTFLIVCKKNRRDTP